MTEGVRALSCVYLYYCRTVDKLNQTEELYRGLKTEEHAVQNLENEIELLGNEKLCFEHKLLPLEQVIFKSYYYYIFFCISFLT